MEDNFPEYISDFIKKIATIDDIMPITVKPGNELNKSKSLSLNLRGYVTTSSSTAKKFAETEDNAIAATPFLEKCLIITSWAKRIPAKGAPNAAEIAAATPLPIMMSCGILGIKLNLRMKTAKVPPK